MTPPERPSVEESGVTPPSPSSIDEPDVGFVILNPMLIWEDYNPHIGQEDLEGMEIETADDLEIHCIVTLSSAAD